MVFSALKSILEWIDFPLYHLVFIFCNSSASIYIQIITRAISNTKFHSFVQVKRNIQTGQSRGFAFIRFKDAEVAKTVLSRPHTILDRRVDVRLSKGKVGY